MSDAPFYYRAFPEQPSRYDVVGAEQSPLFSGGVTVTIRDGRSMQLTKLSVRLDPRSGIGVVDRWVFGLWLTDVLCAPGPANLSELLR